MEGTPPKRLVLLMFLVLGLLGAATWIFRRILVFRTPSCSTRASARTVHKHDQPKHADASRGIVCSAPAPHGIRQPGQGGGALSLVTSEFTTAFENGTDFLVQSKDVIESLLLKPDDGESHSQRSNILFRYPDSQPSNRATGSMAPGAASACRAGNPGAETEWFTNGSSSTISWTQTAGAAHTKGALCESVNPSKIINDVVLFGIQVG